MDTALKSSIKTGSNDDKDDDDRHATFIGMKTIIWTVTVTGYGKRTSAYEYRITARGGQGVANMEMSDRNKEVVSSFPIAHDSQIMMVTDGGKLIRMPVEDIRIAGRKTQGVILFRTAEDERVVSVTWLDADDDDEESGISEEVNEFDGVAEADSSDE